MREEKAPSLIEEIAYRDTWARGLDSYLAMMRQRLQLLHALLSVTGSAVVHMDYHAVHHVKILLDEVFGAANFEGQVIWQRVTGHMDTKGFGTNHDVLLHYVKSPRQFTWNSVYAGYDKSYLETHYQNKDADGRRFELDQLSAAGAGPPRRFHGRMIEPPAGRHWMWTQERIDEACAQGRIVLTKSGRPRYKRYLDEMPGKAVQSVWVDVPPVNSQAGEDTGYPTQKPAALLERLVSAFTNPGGLVLDCFAGGGTTAVAAEKLGRRWIICDNSRFAVHASRKRLIGMNARPFTVENVGFYQRGEAWQDAWGRKPAARVYRNAILELFGAEPLDENSGFIHLHGRKGRAYVHVGPLNKPLTEAQSDAVAQEAAENQVKQVVLLSADYAAMFDLRGIEERRQVKIDWRIIPAAAITAVRDRLARRRAGKEPADPDPIHFFAPPVIGLKPKVEKRKAQVTLTNLEVALQDCLMTQDAKKREEIAKAITHWTSLVDYWAVDWNYDGSIFRNDWQAFRTKKNRQLVTAAEHEYRGGKGERTIAVKVTDIFGNDGLRVFKVTL